MEWQDNATADDADILKGFLMAQDAFEFICRDAASKDNDQLKTNPALQMESGENKKVAIKIIDDRGIESLKIVSAE